MNKWAFGISSFLAGLLFAAGLGLSSMTQPQKIISFLDVTGAWDPSLMFVMGGALAIHLVTFRLITKRKSPLFDVAFQIPNRSEIDLRLLGGSALFGIGWGLSGYCPGPAVVSLTSLHLPMISFFASMLAGMLLFEFVTKKT